MEENKDIFNSLNNFDSEYQLIDESIQQIDELYNETKAHFDAVRNSRSKGSLTFVQQQTGNLVALRTARVSMIKERINIKKIQADFHLKNQRLNPENDTNNDALITQMAEYLIKNDASVNQIEDYVMGDFESKVTIENSNNNPNKMDESVDDIIEKRLQSLQDDGQLKLTDNEKAILYERKQVKICVLRKGKAWKFIAIDQKGKLVKDYPLPDKKDHQIKLKRDEDGSIIAVDQNEKVFEVINKE